MTYSPQDAFDEVAACFYAAWKTVGPPWPVDWPNVPVPEAHLDAADAPWARFTMTHRGGRQTSMGGAAGSRYTYSGRVVVQVFVPVGKQGLVSAHSLGKVVREAFEGKQSTGGVYLEHCLLKEVGRYGPWFQVNVSADFVYYVTQ